jgi:murein DD-endopeptidase MepM/ murein hydrolase activator NlpD
MNIILVSEKLPKARTITLGWPHLVASAAAMFALVFLLAGAMNYGILRFAAELNIPYVRDVLVAIQRQQQEKNQSYLQDNLNAMAVRLGQMQAQLLRLETLGERLAKLAGFKPQDLMFSEVPGRGGAPSSVPSQNLSLGDFTRQLNLLTRQLEDRSDKLGLLESMYTQESARKKLIPTKLPVEGGWYSSNFGWRIDPFTGQRAFHEGIDFMAEEGTPVYSAAAGVVVYAEFHPQYGNMIEIDHGNDLISRYAHASKKYVTVGDVVLRGTRIADVGRTGRATGAHLHFEVRQRGAALNPARFLQLPG